MEDTLNTLFVVAVYSFPSNFNKIRMFINETKMCLLNANLGAHIVHPYCLCCQDIGEKSFGSPHNDKLDEI